MCAQESLIDRGERKVFITEHVKDRQPMSGVKVFNLINQNGVRQVLNIKQIYKDIKAFVLIVKIGLKHVADAQLARIECSLGV